ncbi:MAG: glycosyltransferase [Thermodesulfobacteriota bacterium]
MEISIVITCHNYARYLGRAIRSAMNQSYPKNNYEILVINDASTDETKEVMDSFMGYIRPIHLIENAGLSAARNIGIKRAVGRYVVHVDADDYIGEHLILIESLFLKQYKDWDAVSCDYDLIDDEGNVLETKSSREEPIACGIMFKKDKLFDIGLYDPKFKAMEDVELRRRFEERYTIGNVNLSLYRYRRHDKNLTNNKQKMDYYSKLLNGETR